MKKIIVLVLLMVAFIIHPLSAEVWDVRGMTWKNMTQKEKEFYVSGLAEGALIYETQINEKKNGFDYEALDFLPNIAFEDWIVALDRFYEEEKNEYLSVVIALHAVKLRISGVNEADLEGYLDIERKVSADIVKRIEKGEFAGIEGGANQQTGLNIEKQNYLEDTISLAGGTVFTVLVNKQTGAVEYFWRPAEGWIPVSRSRINFQELYKIRQTLQMLPTQ